MQRFFDIVFSLIAIILLFPFLVIVSIALKITRNDVFYQQERVGLNGKLFYLFKFTTMVKNSENMGTGMITLKNDSRVLPIGKFLRKSKLNELPQLINILNGDMSLIGPRPQDKDGFNAFNKLEQQIIIQVRPGLSGVGPIFFRNEDEIMEKAKTSNKKLFYKEYIAPYKGEIEAWYVKNRSLYLYFKLMIMTLYVVSSNSKIDYNKKFKSFPIPPKELAEAL